MWLIEGVQAGGEEEEGEGSQRADHLRVQNCPQDWVRRWEGEYGGGGDGVPDGLDCDGCGF